MTIGPEVEASEAKVRTHAAVWTDALRYSRGFWEISETIVDEASGQVLEDGFMRVPIDECVGGCVRTMLSTIRLDPGSDAEDLEADWPFRLKVSSFANYQTRLPATDGYVSAEKLTVRIEVVEDGSR